MTCNNPRAACVVKLGGSLLEDKRLVSGLRQWLKKNPDRPHLIVCGGGRLVDALRIWQETHNLDEIATHWSAIRLMSETTRLLSTKFPELPLVEAIIDQPPPSNCLLDVYPLLFRHSRLPQDWSVTSDSLAAETVTLLGLDELVLLKCTLPESPLIGQWQATRFVDATFAGMTASIKQISAVDLLTGNSLSGIRF